MISLPVLMSVAESFAWHIFNSLFVRAKVFFKVVKGNKALSFMGSFYRSFFRFFFTFFLMKRLAKRLANKKRETQEEQ